ncbi:ABC transporter permease [Lentzea sp. NPDC042327]|uniref:ABC transporter permease n=1 Tax=Lentzea sp. NPDC042327 TaxID=3154801 RepID=UPI0033D63574
MLTLSLSTLRERWPLFVGAVMTVALGVALVQAALLVMAATGRGWVPPGVTEEEALRINEGYVGAATLLGMTVPLAAFLAVFIVGSTFAFTVAQRSRDLALLSVLGANRRQLRRLLLCEALFLGVFGTLVGVVLAFPATLAQSAVLHGFGFLPDGFEAPFGPWVLGASVPIGVGVAVLGVLSASRGAARVQPLDALRDTGSAARVMTPGRWVTGLLCAAATAGFIALTRSGDLLVALGMSLLISMTGSVALSRLSPLLVPLVGRLFVLPGSTLAELARANLRDGVRRSASTAAPLIVLVALVLGIDGSLGSLAKLTGVEQERSVRADLVVDSTGAQSARLAALPGVAVAAPQSLLPVSITALSAESPDDPPRPQTYDQLVFAVDPVTYLETHVAQPRSGDLAALTGPTVAGGSAVWGDRLVGETVTLRHNGQETTLRFVARLPETLALGEEFLVSRDAVPADLLATSPTQTFLRLTPGTDPATVRSAIAAGDLGTVRTVAEWAGAAAKAQQGGNLVIMAVLMGLSGLYAAIAAVNAVVIAGAERRAEFAVLRLSGLTRRQVTTAALIESTVVTVVGLLLGALVAAGALIGVAGGTGGVVAVPWGLFGVLSAGALVVTAVACALTTWKVSSTS